jgi:hypothetical protein
LPDAGLWSALARLNILHTETPSIPADSTPKPTMCHGSEWTSRPQCGELNYCGGQATKPKEIPCVCVPACVTRFGDVSRGLRLQPELQGRRLETKREPYCELNPDYLKLAITSVRARPATA